MLFQVYGENAPFQWLGWVLVFAALIAAIIFLIVKGGCRSKECEGCAYYSDCSRKRKK